jgi:hypothetical protein
LNPDLPGITHLVTRRLPLPSITKREGGFWLGRGVGRVQGFMNLEGLSCRLNGIGASENGLHFDYEMLSPLRGLGAERSGSREG